MLIPRGDFEELDGFDETFATACRRSRSLPPRGDAGGSVLFQPERPACSFRAARAAGRREAQGLALFAAKSARTPVERAFALIAGPAIAVLLAVRDLVAGRPPVPR